MTELQVVFIIGAVITLVAGLMVVTIKNLIHAAFYLILTLFGVAVLFVLLNATFLAVIQVVVYIGAIAIMIIMAMMVTRNVTGETVEPFNRNVVGAALVAVLSAGVLIWSLSKRPAFSAVAPPAETGEAVVRDLGLQLFSGEGYLIPTIVASVLLLAALVAAIRIAFPIQAEEDK